MYLAPLLLNYCRNQCTVFLFNLNQVLYTFFDTILSIGTRHVQDTEKKKRLTLLNLFTVLTLSAYLLGVLLVLVLQEYDMAFTLCSFCLLQFGIFYLNSRGWITISIYSYFLFINLSIFYFDSYTGLASGTYLYYFPIMVAIAILNDQKKYRLPFVLLQLMTILFFLINQFTHRQLFLSPSLSATHAQYFFFFNSILSMLITSIVLIFSIGANTRIKSELERMISKKDKFEKELLDAVMEKEVLLAEVHHRVKNNLAVITSLLNLKMNGVQNDYTKGVLLDCRNRIMSMSIIHEKLYKTQNPDRINMHHYLIELIEEIKISYPEPDKKISLEIQCPDLLVNLTEAIPCGLILNELITNAYKYAFTGKETGQVRVFLQAEKDRVSLLVADDGCGFDYTTKSAREDSLGLMLIEALTDQLDGEGSFDMQGGT